MRGEAGAILLLVLLSPSVWATAALPPPGQEAPKFELSASDDRSIGPSSLRGRYVLLVFFAAYCSECRDRISALAESWGECENSESISVVLVGVGGSPDANLEFVRELGVPGWTFAQDDREVWKDFGVRVLGSWVFLGPDWTVLASGEGDVDLDLICRLASPPPPAAASGYSVYKGWVDREAAELVASALGLQTSTVPPARADVVLVIGGPLANPSAAPLLEAVSMSFARTAGGVELRLPNGTVLSVGGEDWARHDFAVVFALDVDGSLWVGSMGCTRYGTRAAALWSADHRSMLKPGVAYLVEWSDLNGDGEVQAEEIQVSSAFNVS